MQLETSRLILRTWRVADRDPFFAINCDPAVLRFLPPISRELSDSMLDRIDAHFAKKGWGAWALEKKASGDLIGLCGLAPVTWETPFETGIEIAWRLGGAWQGKGLAREAATATLDHGFNTIGLDRIISFTTPGNTPSWGLMERLGMRRIGEFDHPNLPAGHALRRHVLYELLAKEYPASTLR